MNMMKALTAMALTAALAFTPINPATVSAAAGWQHIASDSGYVYGWDSTVTYFGLKYSGGGSYKVKVTSNTAGSRLSFYLYESDDGGKTAATSYGKRTVYNLGEAVWDGISVDGSNNKAELFVGVTADWGTKIAIEYYD